MSTRVIVNQKALQRARSGHPWIFQSDVVDLGDPIPEPGSLVEVIAQRNGKTISMGQAFCNPQSQITLRFITSERKVLDKSFWKERIKTAILRRPPASDQTAHRLIHGESDDLPSLVLDRYGNTLVFQTLSAGAECLKETFIEIFEETLKPDAIIERNDPPVRDKEGLLRQKGIVRGDLPQPLLIKEGGFLLQVDPLEGQKTGLFLDQAENHLAMTRYLKGRVLDLFSYQGGFALPASQVAQEVLALDSSASALATLQENLNRNEIKNVTLWEANGFDFLRECDSRDEKFDAIILDPPPFVRNKKNVTGAVRGYKEINLRAVKLLKPDGILVTCSCSHNFTSEMFLKMLQEVSRDTQRSLQVLERRGAAPDHPVLLTFPESEYLQCWVLRVN